MNKEFQVHMLNEQGKKKAQQIAMAFDVLLSTLTGSLQNIPLSGEASVLCPAGRELAIVRTKLEEAAFFAKKAMANDPANGEVVQ